MTIKLIPFGKVNDDSAGVVLRSRGIYIMSAREITPKQFRILLGRISGPCAKSLFGEGVRKSPDRGGMMIYERQTNDDNRDNGVAVHGRQPTELVVEMKKEKKNREPKLVGSVITVVRA